MLADMGAALDRFKDLTVEKKWKVMKVNTGPGKNFFVGLHPDALRIILRSGTLEIPSDQWL